MKASLLARAAPALLLAATLAGGVGTTGFAQTAPAATPPAASTTPRTMPSGSAIPSAPGATTTTHHATTTHRAPGETMQQMTEQRIADLHARLHITAAEQSQWDQFAQVMRDNAKDLDQAYQQRAAKVESMNAVENMQSYAAIEQTRAEDTQKLVPAFQALYASLSDQQKMQADQSFRYHAASAPQHHTKPAH